MIDRYAFFPMMIADPQPYDVPSRHHTTERNAAVSAESERRRDAGKKGPDLEAFARLDLEQINNRIRTTLQGTVQPQTAAGRESSGHPGHLVGFRAQCGRNTGTAQRIIPGREILTAGKVGKCEASISQRAQR